MKKFLNELKEAMRRVDIKDYGFKLASINQQITDDKYEEFQEDIKNHDYCITCNEYEASVFLYPSEEFCYRIRFATEDVWGDYCQCQPTDKEYNDEYECCGDHCDFLNSSFQLLKVFPMGYSSYQGKAKELWADIEQIEDRTEEIEKHKQELQDQIDKLQRKLDSLNN